MLKREIFGCIRKPVRPIFLPVGIFILWSFFWYSSICMWRAEIYYKTNFTEQEQELLRKEFNILSQSEIVFVSGELRMDIRSMQDVTVRISGDDAYELYLTREGNKGGIWYTLIEETEPYVVEIKRERFEDWETAHVFKDILVVLIVAFAGDIISSSKRKSRKIVNEILMQSGGHFRLQEIQYVDGIEIRIQFF